MGRFKKFLIKINKWFTEFSEKAYACNYDADDEISIAWHNHIDAMTFLI